MNTDLVKRTIIVSLRFRVFPTLGQIVEGYVLIALKEHYPCLGGLVEDELKEFIEIKDETDRRIRKAYPSGPPVFFEHGVIGVRCP